MTQNSQPPSTSTEDVLREPTAEDLLKAPHPFTAEVGRITPVCVCGQPQGAEVHHAVYPTGTPSPYGRVYNQCLKKATPDMPLFVVKPTDETALETMEYWYMLNMGKASTAKLNDALELRRQFMAWQQAHPDKVHTPD